MSSSYPVESFTSAEANLLRGRVSNLDRPVFALQNLPDTTKGMLFARYSRYGGTLRRLLLDEFSDSLSAAGAAGGGFEGEHAARVAGRVIGQFGDDSVCQIAGVHLACEWVSNVLTKILQRPRIGAAYMEQSTRYIAFDSPMPSGGYRYLRRGELGAGYERDMDFLFETYAELLEAMTGFCAEHFPRAAGESEPAWRRAVRAKALDICRGILPAASLSHMGIYATAQAYEHLVMHLLAHPLPEARDYGRMILSELQAVIPSFVQRVERPDRGGRFIEYLADRRRRGQAAAERLGLSDRAGRAEEPSVKLFDVHGEELDLLVALLFEEHGLPETGAWQAAARISPREREELLSELLGGRDNRRHRPGRGLERLSYRFEIVSDYGAFRDLQRHRMLTCQWQPLTPDLGAEIPEEIARAGLGGLSQTATTGRSTRHATYGRRRRCTAPNGI